ncbi:hypothetical protein J6590_004793 [Homalodisca vitripennis]|nr:hypothetical protein J6590_004793 [Homalodisca vitripennis]
MASSADTSGSTQLLAYQYHGYLNEWIHGTPLHYTYTDTGCGLPVETLITSGFRHALARIYRMIQAILTRFRVTISAHQTEVASAPQNVSMLNCGNWEQGDESASDIDTTMMDCEG